MPTVTPIQREHQKAIIRSILIFNPSMSVLALQNRLEESGQNHSHEWLTELVKEVREDSIRKLNNQTKEQAAAQFEELVEYVNNQLRAIAQEEKLVYTKTKNGVPVEKAEVRIFAQNNRIKALVEVIKNTERLTQMKMDLGVLERNLGTMDLRALDVLAAVKYVRDHQGNKENTKGAGSTELSSNDGGAEAGQN